jgi:hypothetical protein
MFAVVLNSHPKQNHPTQVIGAFGLLFSVVFFIYLTIKRISGRLGDQSK